MLSLLIADDEKVIRESLATRIDWNKFGVRVVGCCANGLEALDCIIDESPDIIMTDIKMPGLDGLDLIGKIQEINRDIEFIIFSGFREFDFAKKAIELGVRRYILKPVSEEQVVDAVLDAVSCCESRRSVKAALEERNELQQQLKQYHRLQLSYALSFHEDSLDQAVDAYQAYYPDQNGCYFTAALTIPGLDKDWYPMRTVSARFAAAGLTPVTDYFYAKDRLFAVMHCPKAQPGKTNQAIAAQIAPLGAIETGAGASLRSCIRQLHRELTRHSRVYIVDETGNANELHSSGLVFEAMQQLSERLVALSAHSERQELEAVIQTELAAIEELHALRAAGARLIVATLAHSRLPGLAEDTLEGVFDEIYRERNRDELINRVAGIVLTLLRTDQGGNDLVQRVKSYVRCNLTDSTLSLKQIAAQYAHANPDYLSRLFVQETGEKFSHYLNRKRVEKAKQLLQEDASKVYLVAEQVGLGHNPRYFCQVFKRYTGLTPSAYTEAQKKQAKA